MNFLLSNSWILYTLGAAAAFAMTNVLDQMVQRNYAKDALSLSLFIAFFRLPTAFLLFAIFGFFRPSFDILLLSFLHGAFVIIGIIFYLRALHLEEATRVILFFQVVPVFVLFLSFLFLPESLTFFQILSFFLLLFAGFLSVYRSRSIQSFFCRALFWSFLACLFFALETVLLKYVVAFFPSSQLLLPWSYLGGFLALLPLSFFSFIRQRYHQKFFSWVLPSFPLFFASVLVAIVGFFLFFRAAQIGKISLVSVVLGVQPLFVSVFIFLLGKFFRSVPREDFSQKAVVYKFISFVISMLGLYFIQL